MREQIIEVKGRKVACIVLEAGDPMRLDEIELSVSPNDPAETVNALTQSILQRVWILGDKYQGNLIQAFKLSIAPATKVDLYVFGKRRLSQEQAETISNTLAHFHSCLKDKNDWNIQSVQVEAADELNLVSGELKRGEANLILPIFSLFPAAFDSGNYRNRFPCPWLPATVIHEATHLCLEKRLQELWASKLAALGWVAPPDGTRIRMRNNFFQDFVTMEPARCPTPYAWQALNEDRAESVTAYLTGAKLDALRAELVSCVVTETEDEHQKIGEALEVAPLLPELPRLYFHLSQTEGEFTPISNISHPESQSKNYTLEEYWELMGVKAPT